MAEHVTLIEVGLRDGLQSEVPVDTAVKLKWADALIRAGLTHLQIAAFVNPARVPAMADAEAMCEGLFGRARVQLSGLALNMRGLERALAAGLRQVDVGLSASAAHSLRNTNRTVDAALDELRSMIEMARLFGLKVRAAVQCAFGCPPEQDVTPTEVVRLAAALVDAGADELALADSSGQGTPDALRAVLEAVLPRIGQTPLVLHLHDTHGHGYDNLKAGLALGVRRFDTAFGGLGGCPFIAGAAGNIATERTARLLESWGYACGVDAEAVAEVGRQARALLGKAVTS